MINKAKHNTEIKFDTKNHKLQSSVDALTLKQLQHDFTILQQSFPNVLAREIQPFVEESENLDNKYSSVSYILKICKQIQLFIKYNIAISL